MTFNNLRFHGPSFARTTAVALMLSSTLGALGAPEEQAAPGSNPIVRDSFTADPAPTVIGDTLYLYVRGIP